MQSFTGIDNGNTTINIEPNSEDSWKWVPKLIGGLAVATMVLQAPQSQFPIGSTFNDYEYTCMGTITMDDPCNLQEMVIEMVQKEYGQPSIIEEIKNRFLNISEVKDVKIAYDEVLKAAQYNIFIYMPVYNDELVERLIDIEINADDEAGLKGYSLTYLHLPLPYVDIDVREGIIKI